MFSAWNLPYRTKLFTLCNHSYRIIHMLIPKKSLSHSFQIFYFQAADQWANSLDIASLCIKTVGNPGSPPEDLSLGKYHCHSHGKQSSAAVAVYFQHAPTYQINSSWKQTQSFSLLSSCHKGDVHNAILAVNRGWALCSSTAWEPDLPFHLAFA